MGQINDVQDVALCFLTARTVSMEGRLYGFVSFTWTKRGITNESCVIYYRDVNVIHVTFYRMKVTADIII
jgi:hypothetical protein